MEAVFLGCLIFGAIFTVLSVVMGFAHAGVAGPDAVDLGHVGDGGHAASAGDGSPTASAGDGGTAAGAGESSHGGQGGNGTAWSALRLPLFNLSSLLAFLTWFGAAGYLSLSYARLPLPVALVAAGGAGAAGAVLLAAFLRAVLAGERAMNPRDYRLEGTIARVTAGIPAGGTGEIVFTKGGTRRSEAARNATGQPSPRGTEVVVLRYSRGVAYVQAWEDLLRERDAARDPLLATAAPPPMNGEPELIPSAAPTHSPDVAPGPPRAPDSSGTARSPSSPSAGTTPSAATIPSAATTP